MNRLKFTKVVSLLVALMLVIGAVAFAEQDATESPEEQVESLKTQLAEKDAEIDRLQKIIDELNANPNAASSEFADTDAAAEFEGGLITIEEARAEYEYRAYYYTSMGLDPDEYEDIIKQEVVESLVEDAILQTKAEEFGVYELSQEDLKDIQVQAEAAFEENVQYYMAYRAAEGKTDEEVRQETIDYLTGEDYTLEGVIDTLVNETWRDQLREHVTKDIVMTDELLKSYYDDELANAELTYSVDPMEYEYARSDGSTVLWNPQGYRRVKCVLVGFDEATSMKYYELLDSLEQAKDEEERSSLMTQIDDLYATLDPLVEEVYARIEADDDFMLLVDEYSADELTKTEPMRSQGYYVSEDSQSYSTAFTAGAMELENIGDVSQPVMVDEGIYIIKYEADVEPGAVPFDEVKDELNNFALESIKDRTYDETVVDWLDEASIVYHLDRF